MARGGSGASRNCRQKSAFRARSCRFPYESAGVLMVSSVLGAFALARALAMAAGETLHTFVRPERLIVNSGRMVRGYFYMPHSWRNTAAANWPPIRVGAPAAFGATGLESNR